MKYEFMIARVLEKWREEGICVLTPGVAPDSLILFEKTNGVTVPDDLAEFLRRTNGMPPNSVDSCGFHLWQIEKYKKIQHVYKSIDQKFYSDFLENYFIFADLMFDYEFYAIDLSSSRSNWVVSVSPSPPFVIRGVARSFTEFMRIYTDDSLNIDSYDSQFGIIEVT